MRGSRQLGSLPGVTQGEAGVQVQVRPTLKLWLYAAHCADMEVQVGWRLPSDLCGLKQKLRPRAVLSQEGVGVAAPLGTSSPNRKAATHSFG